MKLLYLCIGGLLGCGAAFESASEAEVLVVDAARESASEAARALGTGGSVVDAGRETEPEAPEASTSETATEAATPQPEPQPEAAPPCALPSDVTVSTYEASVRGVRWWRAPFTINDETMPGAACSGSFLPGGGIWQMPDSPTLVALDSVFPEKCAIGLAFSETGGQFMGWDRKCFVFGVGVQDCLPGMKKLLCYAPP